MTGTPAPGSAGPDGGVIDAGETPSGGGDGPEPMLDLGPALTAESIAVVDPEVTYQTTQGWGTSLCWFGNIVGNWSESNEAAVADLLFDQEQGLGLNIVRYNIGGGDAPGHNHMGPGKEMEGFKSSEGAAYDWTADAGQRSLLNAALARIPADDLLIEAFSNSPPYWMTQSGCASGAGSTNNLKSDYYDDFANYLAEVTLHFRNEWGIFFNTLEPFNEPSANWWSESGAQEGCRFDRSVQPTLLRQLRTSLNEKGLDDVLLSAPDETSIDDTLASYQSYDAATKAIVHQVNTHTYSGSRRAELRAATARDGKLLWASEVDGSGAPEPFDVFPHRHDDIAPGLDLANRITLDLKEMQVDAWVFWQAVESEQAQINLNKNWGMLHADYEDGTERYWVTKKYYVMKQYTRAIRPGYTMLDVNDPDAVAFLGRDDGRLVIVQRNATNSSSTRGYDLSNFGKLGRGAAIHRTSESEDYVELTARPVVDGVIAVPIAPRSVTTLVITGVVP